MTIVMILMLAYVFAGLGIVIYIIQDMKHKGSANLKSLRAIEDIELNNRRSK